MSEAFLGEIRIFAGGYAPEYWSMCDGSTVPIAQNQALWSLIGAAYNTANTPANNFTLPDLPGRLPVGQGTGTTNGGQGGAAGGPLTPRTLAQTGGTDTVTLTTVNLPPHNHGFTATTAPATTNQAKSNWLATPIPAAGQKGAYLPATTTPLPTPVAMDTNFLDYAYGTNQMAAPHANMMPYMAISYIICLNGIYPQRP